VSSLEIPEERLQEIAKFIKEGEHNIDRILDNYDDPVIKITRFTMKDDKSPAENITNDTVSDLDEMSNIVEQWIQGQLTKEIEKRVKENE
jgi:Na+/phosphate symporter